MTVLTQKLHTGVQYTQPVDFACLFSCVSIEWEYSPDRALEFARQGISERKVTRGKIKKPAVIGAVIDPKLCLNMLEASALAQAKWAYELMEIIHEGPLPENRGDVNKRARFLDCAVIEMLHQAREMRDRPCSRRTASLPENAQPRPDNRLFARPVTAPDIPLRKW